MLETVHVIHICNVHWVVCGTFECVILRVYLFHIILHHKDLLHEFVLYIVKLMNKLYIRVYYLVPNSHDNHKVYREKHAGLEPRKHLDLH